MLQWLKSVLGMQVPATSGRGISPIVDRSALADFVRLLQEADLDDLPVDHSSDSGLTSDSS